MALAGLAAAYAVVAWIAPALLFRWGRRIARRRGDTRGWRIASRLPLAPIALNLLVMLAAPASVALFVGMELVGLDAPAEWRATTVAHAVASGFNTLTLVAALAVLLEVGCAIAFAYASLVRAPS